MKAQHVLSISHRLIPGMAIVASLLIAHPAVGSGWTDFELEIDDGYRIIRANAFDVGLWGEGNTDCIYHPRDQPDTGPISHYDVTASHIFLKTWGRTARNKFPGDTLEDIDSSKQYFFVYDKIHHTLSRPMLPAEFDDNAAVVREGVIQWTQVRNPDILVPLIGLILLLYFYTGRFGFFAVLLLTIVGLVLFARFLLRWTATSSKWRAGGTP